MKNKTCWNEFVKYSLLNVMGMIGLSCYILADTLFVSLGLGVNGLTALNIAIPIYSFIHGAGLMIGMGGGTRYSIRKNQGNHTDANRVFTNAVKIAMVIAVVFFALGIFFLGDLVRIMGAEGIVYTMSKSYLQVILFFAPMFILNNVLLCFVRNDGEPKLAMIAMLVGSLLNIVLDYVFIFPFGLGMFGAALATGLAPIASMLVLSSYFIKKRNKFHIAKSELTGVEILATCSCGLPSLITEVSSGIVIIVFNLIILSLEGSIGIAAFGVIANLSLVVMSIYTGIAQGMQPLISSNYGQGKKENVQSVLRYGVMSVLIISIIIYLCVYVGAQEITELFNSERNSIMQMIATDGLKIYFMGCVFAGLNIIISVYFTSIEFSFPAHLISVLRGLIVIIPMSIILSKLWGMTGVWLAFPFTECAVSAMSITICHRSKKVLFKKNKLTN